MEEHGNSPSVLNRLLVTVVVTLPRHLFDISISDTLPSFEDVQLLALCRLSGIEASGQNWPLSMYRSYQTQSFPSATSAERVSIAPLPSTAKPYLAAPHPRSTFDGTHTALI